MKQEMEKLLCEANEISSLEKLIKEKKTKIAKLAKEIEGEIGDVGNIEYEGLFYQIRRRKNGTVYICGPRDTPFGSWRKKKPWRKKKQ